MYLSYHSTCRGYSPACEFVYMCDLWGQFEPLLVQDLAYIVSDEGPHVNTVKAIEFTIIIVGVLMGPSFYISLAVPRKNRSFG